MDELFNKLGIHPKDLNLYNQAFSHSSYSNEHKAKQDYERLEFLGDAILDLVVADYLYRNYDEQEGEMTKIRASYVCENALFRYSTDLGLDNYLKFGHGEAKDNHKKAIVADIFESLMGAIYMDLGYATVRQVVLKIIVPYIEDKNITFFSDYKSALQEYVQDLQQEITYKVINETGPAHEKEFTVEVTIDNIAYGTGIANSKKEAEQQAAKDALDKLSKPILPKN
jgi:ribonuclease III